VPQIVADEQAFLLTNIGNPSSLSESDVVEVVNRSVVTVLFGCRRVIRAVGRGDRVVFAGRVLAGF
jgi:hypothetical protein